jgi:formylglycine-generating enzyme required for sulfatase activity
MSLTINRTPRTSQGFIETLLDVGDALPLHMVLVPGGTFLMGSPDDEPERQELEGPQHEVSVSAFFMGRYPVTQAQYETVMGYNPALHISAEVPKHFVELNNPAVGISWNDAVAFCHRLSELAGKPYRLPSESEWEYACRARTTTPFYFGETISTEVANYDGYLTYGDGPEGQYRYALTPVNHFGIANSFGLSDMHGNVYEWCIDAWHENYENAPTNSTTWIEGEESSRRVARGGAWDHGPECCRSAYRLCSEADIRDYTFGFRVCCSAPRAFQ